MPFQYIKAQDLDHWTDREPRRAQELLPKLVEKLILCSNIDVKTCSFPHGPAIQYPGYDGYSDCEIFNAYCPAGVSVWEMGTDKAIKRKFNEDFQKRTEKPAEVSPRETTFCFVTSRSLGSKTRAELLQKAEDSPWKDVRILDATNLEAWMEESPSVAVWLSSKIHGVSGPFFSLDDWFENFCNSTQPNLSEKFFLNGRDMSFLKDVLDAWEDIQKSRVFVSGESSDEVLLTVVAGLRTSDDPRARQMRNSCLVVSDRKQLRDALILTKSLANGVIFATFTPGDEDICGASFGTVMYFVNRFSQYAKSERAIAIPQQSRSGHEDALRELGIEAEALQKVLRNSTRNFRALMRRLESSLVKAPSWAEHPCVEVLKIAMLLGGWREDRDGDKVIIELLSGTKYEEFQTQFTEFLSLEDAPVVRVEKQCFCTCPQDLWDCFAGKLPAALLHRFYDLLPSILSEKDPRYELPEDKWSFAEFYGKESVLEYSETLLEGITSSLVISLQYQREIIDQSGVDVEVYGRSSIRDVLGKMKDVNAMRTIAPRLPDFAEASPSAILAYLEEGVQQPGGGDFWQLFHVSSDAIFGRNFYTHVLWALERMLWNEKSTAVQAVWLLFALSAKNFDYRNMANTPLNTLYDVFRAWYRQTRFTSEEKLALLEKAAAEYPAVFHELTHKILHVGNDIASPMDKPRWRRYEEVAPSPTHGQRQDYCIRIVEIYLRNMQSDYDSWKAILKAPDWFMNRIEDVCALGAEQVNLFASEDRVRIAEELAVLISHHRRFLDGGWALPGKFLARLEALYEVIKPDSVLAYQVYLRNDFEGLDPPIWEEGERDYHVWEATMQKMRVDALRKAACDYGRPAVFSLNFDGASWDIDRAIVDGVLEGEFDWTFLEPLHEKNKLIGRRTIDTLYFKNGIAKMRASMQEHEITGERAGKLWAAVYADLAILDFIEKDASDEEKEAFWDNVQDTRRSEMDEAHFRLIVERLLAHDRPYSIISMFWHCDLDVPELWIRILRAVRSKYPDPEKGDFRFSFIERHIEDLLEKLYRHVETYHAEIAALEFAYLPLLDDAPCSGLQYEIEHNPEFFHEMLCAVYAPDDGQKQTLLEEESGVATLCRKYFWNHRDVPGMSEKEMDGPVFRDWLSQAGELAKSSGYEKAFDIEIGQRLAHAPADANGGWPHKEVCEYLEAGSECLRAHFEIGCHNKRGAYWVNAGETNQELAEQYAKWAERIEFFYPRTGGCLRSMANDLKESSYLEGKRDFYGV